MLLLDRALRDERAVTSRRPVWAYVLGGAVVAAAPHAARVAESAQEMASEVRRAAERDAPSGAVATLSVVAALDEGRDPTDEQRRCHRGSLTRLNCLTFSARVATFRP
jgi:uncharacterized protein YfaQ (DUF2300 family)